VDQRQALDAFHDESVDVLAIDEALTRLQQIDEPQGRIVELRYFGGLTLEETASVVGISLASVKREWAMARAWLRRELAGYQAGATP
jgi:RNA polymerase sigma factor (sigma-70 family)